MITMIDKDTVKIITEKIIDLRPLKKRLIDIESELIMVEKEPEEITVCNDSKLLMKTNLENEKENIIKELKDYGNNI